MAFKFVIFCAALAAVNAGVIQSGWQPNPHTYVQPAATYIQPAATIVKQPALIKQVVHEAPANYEFNYEVHDVHTGDIKHQFEKADNGVVSGQYALVDPDGFRRVVTYTADAHNGFQAKVQREPYGHKVVEADGWRPQITKITSAAPSQGWKSAPSHGWQPAQQISHGWQPAQQISHGWQPAQQISHGWQQTPQVIKVQAPQVIKVQGASHGWQQNPWA